MKEVVQLCEFYGIKDKQLVNKFEKIIEVVDVPKNTELFREGDKVKYLYIMIDGVARGYNITPDGRDVTNCFVLGYGRILSTAPAINECIAVVSAETLIPCRIALLPCDELAKIMCASIEIFKFYEKQMFSAQTDAMMHTQVIQSCTARKRYDWFLENYPGVIDKIPHLHIASFLSITPVTLSRIRRALSEENGEATE